MPLPTATEIRNSLREKVIESFFDEYKELAATGRDLDGKAQGTVTIAGIFIAAIFAYLRDLGTTTSDQEKVFLTIAVVCLIVSVVLSILALRIRKVAFLPLGEFTATFLRDLHSVDDEAEVVERSSRFFDDQVAAWGDVKKDGIASNKLKGAFLWSAQVFVVMAVLSASVLVMIRIYK
jgi:hypothetical protein